MDDHTFHVELTKAGIDLAKALVWPLFLAAGVVVYRRHLGLLLVAAARVLKRLRSLKFPGVELASNEVAQAVASAADNAEQKAADVGEKLGSATLPPEEREKLVAELTAAVAEAERLRGLVDRLRSQPPGIDRSLLDPVQVRALMGLHWIVQSMDANRFLASELDGTADSLAAAVQAFLNEASERVTEEMATHALQIRAMRQVKYIGEDNWPTREGIKQMHRVARRVRA